MSSSSLFKHFLSNPNRNTPGPTLTPPSSSPKPNRTTKKKPTKAKKNPAKSSPNWLSLPEEVWVLILSKITTINLIEDVQKVCMLFHKICKQHSMYKIIDMQLDDAYMDLDYDLNVMTRFAVDRSAGGLVDIYLEYLCDDDTLMYIVQRSKNLKHLRLGHYVYVSDKGLIEAVKSLPMLEELEIIICSFSGEFIEPVGRSCPSLRSFTLNHVGIKGQDWTRDEEALEALAVARSMPNLRKLQLIGNGMTNVGLKAILDGCPLLESLDLRACFHVDLSGDLGKRCERIKNLRRPNDSTADYPHTAVDDDGY